MQRNGGITSLSLHTAKVKKYPTCWGGRARQGRNSRAPMAQSHLCWLQNIESMVPNIFLKEGRRDEFGCYWTPCPCCPVSMEMREGQDVAHSDYLGGWPARQLVNTSPSTPTQHIQLSPSDPHAHCLLHGRKIHKIFLWSSVSLRSSLERMGKHVCWDLRLEAPNPGGLKRKSTEQETLF